MPKVLFVGCEKVDCPFINVKDKKCTRNVIMHDENGRCKSWKINKKISWWKKLIG